MDLSKQLVRKVIRAFYSTHEILVVEALVTHSCLRDNDLAYLLNMNTKDLHKLCAGLAAQRVLIVASRQEAVESKARPVSRTYYFIDYRQCVDAIKWRVYRASADMQGSTGGGAGAASEAKDYFCPTCKAEWSLFEVLDAPSEKGFRCHKCDSVLTMATAGQGPLAPGHQQSARMNDQFKFMTELLPQIDQAGVPECTFDKALASARPVERAATHEVVASVPVDAAFNKPTAVKGLANVGPKTMTVTITDSSAERDAAEETRKRKEQLAANALPSWITDSSVPAVGQGFTSFSSVDKDGVKAEEEEEGASQPAKKVKLEHKEEEDEDELEFEDVV